MLPHPTITKYEFYKIASEIMNKQRKKREISYAKKIEMMKNDLDSLADVYAPNLE